MASDSETESVVLTRVIQVGKYMYNKAVCYMRSGFPVRFRISRGYI